MELGHSGDGGCFIINTHGRKMEAEQAESVVNFNWSVAFI